MPELAEVEFYRKQWSPGLNQKIISVETHGTKRIFRGTDTELLENTISGAAFLHSFTHGKQMLFSFSKDAWLGIHLGMSGKLLIEPPNYSPAKHDHLVLHQKTQTLVFNDPRQFGRILFTVSKHEPEWWKNLPPSIVSNEFNRQRCESFVQRHGKSPIKAILLMQNGFPGIGNWMADEILWRARIHPSTQARQMTAKQITQLWKTTKEVSSKALATIGKDFSDPPKSWLFQHRWEKGGDCPRCGAPLHHATIGGRTTCWCKRCQPE